MTVKQLTRYFIFLDRLRDSGATNMFGAVHHLIEHDPNLTDHAARHILVSWMGTFSAYPVAERAKKALKT